MEWALDAIESGFRWVMSWLSTLIYQVIIWLYDIFMKLCNSRVLDSEVLELMAKRVGVILGLIMLFMTMFSVVQLVLEPEKLTDKEKGLGNIVKKILVVIVMLGMSSSAFSLMYGVQKTIINSNIIAKFLLPYDVDTTNFGGLLASELFTAFYRFDDNLAADGLTADEETCRSNVDLLKTEIVEYGEFARAYAGNGCLNTKSGGHYMVDFNALISPIVGALAVYFIFSYCLSVGMRTFQLAFLEIISPMAIVSYLSPKKDTMFQKWWKIYFSTYIDVFLRIAIINVAVFLIAVIFDANMSGTFWESVGGKTGGFTTTVMTVFIIMSLLMFAKKAPDLLKELFPASPSKLGFGITPPKKLIDNMAGADLIKRGYGAVNAGTRAWGKNVRKAVGELAFGDAKDRKENALHLAGAIAFGGFAGARRGLMTTDAAGRNRAVENAYAARQSKLKLRKLGYGMGDQVRDNWRGFWQQDQYIEDMAAMKEIDIANRQEELRLFREQNHANIVPVAASKSHKDHYIINSANGPLEVDGNFQYKGSDGNMHDVLIKESDGTERTLTNAEKVASKHVADMESAIGKARGDTKKINQKAEEQKQKANGGKK